MRVLIVEDESGVAKNLVDLIHELDPTIEVLAILQSIQETLEWMNNHAKPDLGFFDIRLADGDSFQIFDRTTVRFPVIFTTAYDEYALRAFKVNSIDYLLKPVDKESLESAIAKYRSFYQSQLAIDNDLVLKAIQDLKSGKSKKYKQNFLTHAKDRIIPIRIEEIAYFFVHNEMAFCYTHEKKRFIMDQSLDKIEDQVDPHSFFRANRQYIISRRSVVAAVQYFQRKLKLELNPKPEEDVLVSKTKASAFKRWLET
ncbi:MAG: LytTR family DNA-binding domain-containing protein [Bacteroidota bacterium]|nr:LytTR family DNA-binding domain-containing protein [Bacteroidota bacterium]